MSKDDNDSNDTHRIMPAIDLRTGEMHRVPVPRHDAGDCLETCTRAVVNYALEKQTVYEAPGAKATASPSVGWSRPYADNFDACFGKRASA